MESELKPCPFCGGNAKISFKDKDWGGWNGKGDCRKAYRIQAICKRCFSRGKPVTTEWLINPKPNYSIYYGKYKESSLDVPAVKEATEMFKPYVEQAVEGWNRRCNDGT